MTKEYQKTHPWITFCINPKEIDTKTWILLGEAKSKCERISETPLKPKLSEILHGTYFVKGIHGTTAIEGNTLSEDEVRRRIDGKLKLPDSMEYQGKEVDNAVNASNKIANETLKNDKPAEISSEEIKNYNRMILEGLPLDKNVVPGEVRQFSVGVLRYRGAPSKDCEYLLDTMCEWLNGHQSDSEEDRIVLAIIRAVLAHLYIAWIHPFGDGNGRTARLVELKIMLASGMPKPACHLLSNHYNLTRGEYYRQLDYASESGGDVYKFIHYAVRGLVDQLRKQIEFIDLQQSDIFLKDYIFESFGENPGKIAIRKRTLALEFLNVKDPVKITEIRRITPKVAEMYSGKHDRTVKKDVEFLLEKNLVAKKDQGYVSNFGVLFRFRPDKLDPD